MAEASVEIDTDPLEQREAGLSHVEGIGNATGEDMSILHAQPQSSAERTSVVHHQHHQQQQTAPGRDRSADDNRVELPTTPLPPYYHFNTLLLEISEEITSSVLEKIKFLYKDEIKSKLVEKIGNARELFKVLEQRRYIMPESLIHLQKCVMMIDDQQTRVALMERIFKYSQEHKAVYFRRSTDEPPNGYRRYQCHIKGVEHYKFNTDSVRILLYTVASLTGIDQSEILVDEIQLTNSIYITFLVKDVHYTMFHALLKKGLPLLSELNVDMVTFLDIENGETIDVSSGRNIYAILPPVQESPEQTIQRLNDAIEKVQLQNIDQKREIEQLSATVELLSAEVQMDSNTLSENVRKAMQDAFEEGVSKQSVLRMISLNTQLVKSIEKKGGSAIENKLRAEIQCLEVELDECKAKLQLLHGSESAEDGPVDQSTKRKHESADEDPRIENSEDTSEAASDKVERALQDNLQDALNRAQDLGYTKTVIDQIVYRNTVYTEYKCMQTYQIQKQELLWNNRLLQDGLNATSSLLQRTDSSFGFKQSLMSQLETIFKSKGNDIPTNKGYKVDVIKLAMDLSSKISYDEEQKLLDGFKDVEITSKVKRDRRFLLLRHFYIENLNSDTVIIIETFVAQKLHVIHRDDLGQVWNQRVRPSDPALQLQDALQKLMVDMGLHNPGLVGLLQVMSSKLTDHDKSLMRKMLPKGEQCPDQDLMLRLVQTRGTTGPGLLQPDIVMPSVTSLLNDIKRLDLREEFEIRYLRLLKGFRPDLQEILRSTCSQISKSQKRKMKNKLADKRFVDNDDDILELLAQEKFEGQQMIRIDEVDACVKDNLDEFKHQSLYDGFEQKLIEKGLKGVYQNVQVKLQTADIGQQRLILEKLAELSEEIKSMKANQAGHQTTMDVLNPTYKLREQLTNESKHRQFFKETIPPGGVLDFRNWKF